MPNVNPFRKLISSSSSEASRSRRAPSSRRSDSDVTAASAPTDLSVAASTGRRRFGQRSTRGGPWRLAWTINGQEVSVHQTQNVNSPREIHRLTIRHEASEIRFGSIRAYGTSAWTCLPLCLSFSLISCLASIFLLSIFGCASMHKQSLQRELPIDRQMS